MGALVRGLLLTYILSIESNGQMDTFKTPVEKAAEVEARLKEIKAHMPETYKAITAKAGLIGSAAFRFVRQGVAGEPNKFYALEGGRVVGAPFNLPGLMAGLEAVICEFGCNFMIMWAPEAQQLPQQSAQQGVTDGAR